MEEHIKLFNAYGTCLYNCLPSKIIYPFPWEYRCCSCPQNYSGYRNVPPVKYCTQTKKVMKRLWLRKRLVEKTVTCNGRVVLIEWATEGNRCRYNHDLTRQREREEEEAVLAMRNAVNVMRFYHRSLWTFPKE